MEGHPFLSAYDAEYETFYMIVRISVKANEMERGA